VRNSVTGIAAKQRFNVPYQLIRLRRTDNSNYRKSQVDYDNIQYLELAGHYMLEGIEVNSAFSKEKQQLVADHPQSPADIQPDCRLSATTGAGRVTKRPAFGRFFLSPSKWYNRPEIRKPVLPTRAYPPQRRVAADSISSPLRAFHADWKSSNPNQLMSRT
jgi:hypothetical protein